MAVDRYKVLIVEEEPCVRELIAPRLAAKGIATDSARDGAEAAALIAANSYAVVVVDLVLPAPAGLRALEMLAESASPAMPVVLAVTGADRSALDRFEAHVHGVVRKPFDPDELAALVARCVEIRGSAGFGAMALATMMLGEPLIAWLSR